MPEVKKRFTIALDIKRESSNREFEVVEGDNGNELVISLFDGGVPVDLTGCLVLAVFKKSDGSSAEQDSEGGGITLDPMETNKFTVRLYITSFTSGKVECEIQIYSGTDNSVLVTSANFRFKCRKGIFLPETVEAVDEYPLLVQMVSDVTALETSVSSAESERVSRDAAFRVFEEYDPVKEYVPLNKVTFEGSSYENRVSCTGVPPTNTAYWLLIAKKGTDGKDGIDGQGDMNRSVYDPQGKAQDAFAYADGAPKAALAAAPGKAAPADTDALELLDGTEGALKKLAWADIRASLSNDFAAKEPAQYILMLPVSGWTGAAPYSLTVAAPGVTELQIFDIDWIRSSDPAIRVAEQEAWNCATMIQETADGFTITCDEKLPQTSVGFIAIYKCDRTVV